MKSQTYKLAVTALLALLSAGQGPQADPLEYRQQVLAERFADLTAKMVAFLGQESAGPEQAAVREALQQAQAQGIHQDMAQVLELIAADRLPSANRAQDKVVADLHKVLEALSQPPPDQQQAQTDKGPPQPGDMEAGAAGSQGGQQRDLPGGQSGGASDKLGQPQGQPTTPAEQSTLPPGQADLDVSVPPPVPPSSGSPWGQLSQAQREVIQRVYPDRFSQRYTRMCEHYFQRLAQRRQ